MGPNSGESEADYLTRRIEEVGRQNEATHGKVDPGAEQAAADKGERTDAQNRAAGGSDKPAGK